MKVKTKTITTKTYTVDIGPEDWLMLKMGSVFFGLKRNLTHNRLDFYNLKEGALIGNPVFSLGADELEDLSAGYPKPTETMYIQINFPAMLYPKVKERLKDLPIALPVQEA